MKKLISSLATVVLIASSVASVTAVTQQNKQIPEPFILGQVFQQKVSKKPTKLTQTAWI